jgi:hypothetical protein
MAACNRITEKALDAAAIELSPRDYDTDAGLLANVAVRKIFTLEEAELKAADKLLAQAFEIERRGVFAAWRAKALVIAHMERYSDDFQTLKERTEELCRTALTLENDNSNVLASVAYTYSMVDQNIAAGYELAKLAVQRNQGNPLAWWALSNNASYAGKEELAYYSAFGLRCLPVRPAIAFGRISGAALRRSVSAGPMRLYRIARPRALLPQTSDLPSATLARSTPVKTSWTRRERQSMR